MNNVEKVSRFEFFYYRHEETTVDPHIAAYSSGPQLKRKPIAITGADVYVMSLLII